MIQPPAPLIEQPPHLALGKVQLPAARLCVRILLSGAFSRPPRSRFGLRHGVAVLLTPSSVNPVINKDISTFLKYDILILLRHSALH
jgi:hypothetical protein